jgi:predicted nucleic acid-binding protein
MKHGVYDFSKVGGAVGSFNLVDDDGATIKIPANALVLETFVFVETAATSGGSATISLGLESAVDLLAATAVASFSSAAKIAGIPVSGTLSTSVLATVERNLTLAVAVAALTAGKVHVFVSYVHAKGN